MKTLLAALAALALLGTGCVLAVPVHRSSSAASSDSCPPGHRWSDGTCHDKGKGHDPAKHQK